jgi:predicted nucleotidyltransferase
VDKSFYFQQLYPLQDEVLKLLTGLDTGLYLTGGTAASRGYLAHRFSDDLDLFANDAQAFALWADRLVQELASEPAWNLKVAQREKRFVRLFVEREKVSLKIELINDVPAHAEGEHAGDSERDGRPFGHRSISLQLA